MSVENLSQWPARPLGLARCREDAWMSLRVLWNGDDSRNSYIMSTSPVPSGTLSTFLSVSNTLRKGRLGTWYQACMTPVLYKWNPSPHPTTVYVDGVPTVAFLMNIYHLFFSLSLSTRYLTLFLYLGHSCRMCPSKRPRQAEAPRGLECKGEEAEKQKQWGHCSRHRAATAHGVLRDLSVGGQLEPWAAWCCSPSLLAWLPAHLWSSLPIFPITLWANQQPFRKFWSFCHNTDQHSIIIKRTPGISVGIVELLLSDSLKI